MDDKNNISSGVTLSTLQNLQEKFRVSASQALGQNFLIDPNISRKIATSIGDTKSVIEVGPGIGSLTVALANECEQVVAIELDQHILEPLDSVLHQFGVSEKVEVINGDVMQVDLEKVCQDNRTDVIIGNLPYNISAPLLANICVDVPSAKTVVAMVQKEVGERLAAEQGSRSVSSITLKCQFFMDISLLFSVSQQSFIPRPKVDSVVIKMERKPSNSFGLPDNETKNFFKIIDLAFSQRRKMLRKSLIGVLGDDPSQIFLDADLDPTLRPEACTLEDFHRLFVQVKKLGTQS